MNAKDFYQLCWGASVELGLADLTALADGSDIFLGKVRIKSYFVDGQAAALVVADLGHVAPEDRVSVFETLLAIQLAAWDKPIVRFGLHPMDESIVLSVHVALDDNIDRVSLATLLRSMAAQVVEWREVHLAGKVSAFAPPSFDSAATATATATADHGALALSIFN